MNPAIIEEINMINFAELIIASSLNASKVTKIDIVKPIPPKHATPIICDHFTPLGK